MLTYQAISGNIVNAFNAPVPSTVVATVFASTASTSIVQKTVITESSDLNGNFVINLPVHHDCSISFYTLSGTRIYSTSITTTSASTATLASYVAEIDPVTVAPYTEFLLRCSIDADTGFPLWDGNSFESITGHTHNNKTVLDQFGESAGQPTYNNQIIYTASSAIDGGTFN